MDSVDFDLLNEKIHPRKRLKGRKHVSGISAKGSQRKIRRFSESYRYAFPEEMTKAKNPHFSKKMEQKGEGIEFDDGEIDIDKDGYGYTRWGNWPPFGYSINKRKRWELFDKKLNRNKGYHSRLPKTVEDIQDEIFEEEKEEEEGNTKVDINKQKYNEIFEAHDEAYDDYIRNQKKYKLRMLEVKKEEKKKGKKNKVPKYISKEKEKEDEEELIGLGYWERWNLTYERRQEKEKTESIKREKKEILKEINQVKKNLKRIEKEKNKYQKQRKVQEKGETRRRNRRTLKKKELRGKMKKEKDQKRKNERERLKDIVLSNKYYYEFSDYKKGHKNKKMFIRRPRKKGWDYFGYKFNKHQRRRQKEMCYSKKRRNLMKKDVRDLLTLKY